MMPILGDLSIAEQLIELMQSNITRAMLAAALSILSIHGAWAGQLSDSAGDFIAHAEEVVLAGCPRPLPSKACRQGHLLHHGAPEEWNEQDDTTTIQTAEYEGMDLALHRDRLVSLTVTSPSWPLPMGLRIGMTAVAVEQALGPPTRREFDAGNQVLKYVDDDGLASAIFEIDSGTGHVIAVRWSFFYD